MADPSPTERPMPVGYRFHPIDEELVGHYLRRKLMAEDPSIHNTIPEIEVCKHKPLDLLASAVSAASATKFDKFHCYFFRRCDYKYPNSTRWNRATSHGIWKVTGRDREIKDRVTNNVIGTMKTLVFYEGRVPPRCKTNWVIHEYHDAMLSSNKRTHVLCWLRKKYEKKTEERTYHEGVSNKTIIFEYEDEANICMISEESHLFNMSSTTQLSHQSNEAIDSMTQSVSQSNEVTNSMTQLVSQSNETTDSMTQPVSQSNEAPNLGARPVCQLKEAPNSGAQPVCQLKEALDSAAQPVSQINEAPDSGAQPESQINEALDSRAHLEVADSMTLPPFQLDETMNSVLHAPPEPNSVVGANSVDGTIFDAGELGYRSFDDEELDLVASFWPPMPPSMQGLFENDGNI